MFKLWCIVVAMSGFFVTGASLIGYADKGMHHAVNVGLIALGLLLIAYAIFLAFYLLDREKDNDA